MRQLTKVPDRFHTRQTRSCSDIRERVNVSKAEYQEELIGDGATKFSSKLATDLDDAYVNEFFNHRSKTHYQFLPKTEIEKLRENFRNQIEMHYIKDKCISDQIHAVNEETIIKELKIKIESYENVLDFCQETTHRKSIKTGEQVKSFYQSTDVLRIQYESVFSKIEPLKMKIFYHGNEVNEKKKT